MIAHVSVRDMARILLPRQSFGGGTCVLSAYFDDSGTHTTSPFVVMACVIGSEAQWSPFEGAWKAQLLEPLPGKPALSRFHMTDCVNRLGEFQDYSDAEVDLVIKTFRDLILDAGVHGYAIGVPRQEWDNFIIGARRFFFGDAEGHCTRYCICFAAEWTFENSSDRQVTVIFDDGPQHISRAEQIAENLKMIFTGGPGRAQLFGPSFLPVVKFAPLQAADMFAWETYAYGCEWKDDPFKSIRLHYKRLIESNRFVAGFMDREKIEALGNIFVESS